MFNILFFINVLNLSSVTYVFKVKVKDLINLVEIIIILHKIGEIVLFYSNILKQYHNLYSFGAKMFPIIFNILFLPYWNIYINL
jgi:hypothetical protein